MVEKTLSAADLPKLVVQLPDGKEVHHSIVGTEITIGRDPSNRIPIADQFVSKFHAKLVISQSSITLVDLGSANKTYVNGAPIREAAVKYGDELQFAGVRCRLLAPEGEQRVAAKPAPPPPPPRAASVPRPAPPSAPSAASVSAIKPKAAAAPGRSAPPKIEADPMKKLLRIGGLLIAVSLALGVLLRVLLVPSGDAPPPEESASNQSSTPAATTAPPEAPPPSNPPASNPPPVSNPPGQTAPPANAGASTADEYFDQALSFLDTGRLKEARSSFQKVLEIDPDNTRAKTRLSLLEEEIAQKADRHFGNARQAFQYLRYEEAIGEWEMFLTLADESDVRYAEAEQGIQQAKAKLR
jgi:pSer/pThr/pTyr-binding forkhead associated (FHA) protein